MYTSLSLKSITCHVLFWHGILQSSLSMKEECIFHLFTCTSPLSIWFLKVFPFKSCDSKLNMHFIRCFYCVLSLRIYLPTIANLHLHSKSFALYDFTHTDTSTLLLEPHPHFAIHNWNYDLQCNLPTSLQTFQSLGMWQPTFKTSQTLQTLEHDHNKDTLMRTT